MNGSNFRSMQLLKEWPWHRKFVKSLIVALLSFSSVSQIPYYVNFRFNNWPNMSSVRACFLRQFVTLEACSCRKNDRDTINLLSHWYDLYSLLVQSVIFRITSTSGLIIGQICRQFLHAFYVDSVVILKMFLAEVFCIMCLRSVLMILTEVKELRTVLNVFIFCVLKTQYLQILTISLQVNFYQINFIQWFYENVIIYKVQRQTLCNKNQQFWIWYY